MCPDIPALMERLFFAALSATTRVETTQASFKKVQVKLIMVKPFNGILHNCGKKNEEAVYCYVLIWKGV